MNEEEEEEEEDEDEDANIHDPFDEEKDIETAVDNHHQENQPEEPKEEEGQKEVHEHVEKKHYPLDHEVVDNRCRGDDSTPCPGSNVIICSDQFCDGTSDCPNGADELNCNGEEETKSG